MSAIHDLINQITDPRLRERLTAEWAKAAKGKKFGLVFEEQLPELLPLYHASPRQGDLVCRRGGPVHEVWQVQGVHDDAVVCLRPANSKHPSEPVQHAAESVRFQRKDVLVVREFGEPIFPALVPRAAVANGPADAPWHTLIEADNYHALQLLCYLYAGQVDCIYIDPPYNTGARDWKYNNDYVDGNDGWRHSKWLAFMEKRLKLAKRLLKPDTGVLIITIDEHEVHHLGMLLEREFPEAYRQMVTIVVTPGGVTQGRFARVEEYAIFCFNNGAFIPPSPDDLLSSEAGKKASPQASWQSLIRRGVSSRRIDRPGMFYPVLIDPLTHKILGAGAVLPLDEDPDWIKAESREVAWPVRSDGELGRWRIGPTTFNKLHALGFIKLGRYDEDRRTSAAPALNG